MPIILSIFVSKGSDGVMPSSMLDHVLVYIFAVLALAALLPVNRSRRDL